jgi:hypothetical protein
MRCRKYDPYDNSFPRKDEIVKGDDEARTQINY